MKLFLQSVSDIAKVLIICLCICFCSYLLYRFLSDGDSTKMSSRLSNQLDVVFSSYSTNNLSQEQKLEITKILLSKYDPSTDNLSSTSSGGKTMKLEDILRDHNINPQELRSKPKEDIQQKKKPDATESGFGG